VNVGLTWGRVAVYLHLGYFWSGAAAACGISLPPLGAQVRKLPHACMADPPAGSGNANAYNAGVYDYYCGYYRYTSGTDFGYCSQATTYAQAAGVTTAATGFCQATPDGNPGTYWASQAGYFDYLCRYYEYLGYGSDYGGYCFSSSLYAAKGRCNSCDMCTPACAGHLCGTIDGCGGTCFQGSGCCNPSCSGKICGQSDGCTSTCQPGSGCTSAPLQNYPPKGLVDGYNTQHVWGWACDPDYPDQSNRVDFYTIAGQNLGSVGAFLSSSAAISSACLGGFAHYFDFARPGGIPSGTHIMAYSIDLPYATPGNDNRAIGGQGSVGNGTEFIIP
jgi:hypothetical protein